MDFALRIEIGNDAMCTTEHLVAALRGVANRLETKGTIEELPRDGTVKDENGNSVGGWCFDE